MRWSQPGRVWGMSLSDRRDGCPSSPHWEQAYRGRGTERRGCDQSLASGAAMAGNEFKAQAGRNVLQARHGSWIVAMV